MDKRIQRADTERIHDKKGKNYALPIITFAILANVAILLLFFAPFIGYQGKVNDDIYILPKLNAVFNSFTFIFLVAALIAIKKKRINLHRGFILAAFTTTFLFLLSYLSFHFIAPPAHFGGTGPVRPIYFFILITHSTLAALVVFLAPFATVWGWTMQVRKHKRIVRWTMPIWLYVSLTGVVVYLMMAPYY
ncbi:DUF420 domain-containing protein [Sporolactobacillus sp. THM19-2]|jgi:putative membrane protein|uniref:DUF420 domain-containing protein n=1 Tax=Sporolactobacillus sp. THM19-2 TaxID=2511171 RepID=UPI0010210C4B|nr:DUF420 domain-containing protein [Sporolactobacillus sp. THM19-2]RYL94161.1 DUF420 domain-containing protein [Sporolactobacillus sp. THM19-2]